MADESKFLSIIYRGLGLPEPADGQYLPADFDALTASIDGNLDIDMDGSADLSYRNGWVEPEELYVEVFNNRDQYAEIIGELKRAGFDDPLEISGTVKFFAYDALKEYGVASEFDRAIAIAMAILPADTDMVVNGRPVANTTGPSEKISIQYNNDTRHPLRKLSGYLDPDEILAAPGGEGVANCMEYSMLMAVLLRSSGIHAQVVLYPEEHHSFVTAMLDGVGYKIDIANGTIEEGGGAGNLDSDVAEAHYASEAIAFYANGEFALAASKSAQALEIRSDDIDTRRIFGSALLQLKKYKESASALQRYVDSIPDDAGTLLNLGLAYTGDGRSDDALRSYEKVLKIDPKNDKALSRIGSIYVDKGSFSVAIGYFERALERDPKSFISWNNLGDAYLKSGDAHQAEICFQKALAIEKNHPVIWNNMAQIYARKGDQQKAAQCRERACMLSRR